MADPVETDPRLDLARRLSRDVLDPMKRMFVGKDEIVDLLGVCLAGGENLFILGPPGTAKSALVHELARGIHGRAFDYLLTRFTEPNELFGPFDIRKLRDGELVTNTEGMLPEASLVFLDELLNANSAILNSLLMVLNERVFRRGRETRALPTLMVVGASNRLPDDDALAALFDRFLLRVRCDNVSSERLLDVLEAGWKLARPRSAPGAASEHVPLTAEDIRAVQSLAVEIDLSPVRTAYVELIHRLRHAGLPISDRRAVKLQRLTAASAVLCGRKVAQRSDLWILRYIWDTEAQQEILAEIVQEALRGTEKETDAHPRVREREAPDPEALARELDALSTKLETAGASNVDRSFLQDRLGLLSGRCQWVADSQQRTFLGRPRRGALEALWRCDVSAVWAVRMNPADLSAALRLRLTPGVEAAIVEPLTSSHVGQLWLRGRIWDEAIQQQVARLPADARYTVAADGQLTPLGARVPNAYLPKVSWKPLLDFARLKVQTAGLPGRGSGGAALRLVPSGEEREAGALLAAADDWRRYALDAPEVRLDRLAFAATNDGRVLVWGQPLPPIPGVRLTESEGVFVPCGWALSPAIDSKLVRRVLKLPTEDLALFIPPGSGDSAIAESSEWERVPRDAFVRTTRAAVRATFDLSAADDVIAFTAGRDPRQT